jgi:lactoylglutathione lyase
MMKLSQIRLMVKNFDKSIAFYKDVMEFPLGFIEEKMQFASFNTGETKIEIISYQGIAEVIHESNQQTDENNVDTQSKFLLTFAVDQVDEFCSRLKEKGVVLLNEPHDKKDWNARVAHLRDPDGNIIELYKHPL